MRRIGWYAVRVTTAAFVLGGVALLAANLYVQSHGVQQRIHAAVETALGLPVRLQKTTVTPWEGLRLDGVALRADAAGGFPANTTNSAPEFLTAASFRVRFAWWPLLARREIIIEKVLLDRPSLVWQQDGDGRWSFPPGLESVHRTELVEPASGDTQAAAMPTPPVLTTPAIPSASDAPPPPLIPPSIDRHQTAKTPAEPQLKGLSVPINSLHIRHGQIELLSPARRPLLRMEEINSDSTIAGDGRVQGAVWLAKASVPSTGVVLTDYRTAVDYSAREGLILRDGRGALAGGSLRTDLRVAPATGRKFTAACSLDGAALGRLTSGSPKQPPLAEGQLCGNLECHGSTDDPESRAGGGRLWLVGARLRESAPMKFVGQMLRINDLTQLEFKQADLEYKVMGKVVRVESLVLAANDIRVEAHGDYLTSADQLDLHGRLIIDRAVSRQLPQFIESNFTPCGPEAEGCRYLDFDVSGPPNDPKSNLYERLTAGPMKGLFDNLVAPKPRNPKNKPRDRENSADAPATSPLRP